MLCGAGTRVRAPGMAVCGSAAVAGGGRATPATALAVAGSVPCPHPGSLLGLDSGHETQRQPLRARRRIRTMSSGSHRNTDP